MESLHQMVANKKREDEIRKKKLINASYKKGLVLNKGLIICLSSV